MTMTFCAIGCVCVCVGGGGGIGFCKELLLVVLNIVHLWHKFWFQMSNKPLFRRCCCCSVGKFIMHLLCNNFDLETRVMIDVLLFTALVQCQNDCIVTKQDHSTKTNFHTGWFFNWSARFSVPKWKTSCSQPGLFFFYEIFNVKKLLVGWACFFILILKIGRTS